MPRLARRLFGTLSGDQGFIFQARAEQLLVMQGLPLVTTRRKTMRNVLLPLAGKPLLRKRARIASIIDQFKNSCHIEHTRRRRSPMNFLVHLLAVLAASCHHPKKPSLVRHLPTLMLAE